MAEDFIKQMVDWISIVSPLGIYAIFFALAYFENIIPPIPGDVLVAFGGYLAAEQIIGFFPLLVVTVIASVIGFMNMYWLGYKWGDQIESNKKSHFVLRFLDYRYFRKGKFWMAKWGQWVVLLNRFLAGTRSVISLTAGMSKLRISYTVMNSFFSSLMWNFLLLGLGWIIQDNWPIIGEYLSNYGKIILGLIVLAIMLKIFWRKRKKAV